MNGNHCILIHWKKYFWPWNGQKYLWPSHGQKYLWTSHGQKYLWTSHGQKYLWPYFIYIFFITCLFWIIGSGTICWMNNFYCFFNWIDIYSCTSWFCFPFLKKYSKLWTIFQYFQNTKRGFGGFKKRILHVIIGNCVNIETKKKREGDDASKFCHRAQWTKLYILFLNPPNPRFVFWKYWKMIFNFEYFLKEMKTKSGTTININ